MKRTIITIILTLTFTAFAIHAVEQTAFKGAGIIESTVGGFKFPDGSVQASATTLPCTAITYVPFNITEEGVYCFIANLETSETSGNAISISADNVVIDLNGWMLDGLSAGVSTLKHGFYANQRANITIRNGTIRGFNNAILLADPAPFNTSSGHLIENIRADNNTTHGFWIAGSNNVIRHNHVLNSGGSPGATGAVGIRVLGSGARVLDNEISDTVAYGEAANGLMVYFADNAIVQGNRIHNASGFDPFPGHGIEIYSSTAVLVRGNSITDADVGVHYHPAGDGVPVSTGKYMDNLTDNVTIPFAGGTAVGVND